MKFSGFGEKFAAPTGITVLMDVLGRAMAGDDPILMLGGGNPAHIPRVQSIWRRRMQEILDDGAAFDRMLANYDTPRGDRPFIRALCSLMQNRYGWPITEENVGVTNGGQSALFCLLNMFSGPASDGARRRILFPLMPEYIGYADQGLDPDAFHAMLPRIKMIDRHVYKYHVDFDQLDITEDIGAICVSRPTNPTGNVLTDVEIRRLAALARQHDIPLIVDNAYGIPFPGIIFTEATPIWDDHMVLTFSLSKLGLPGTRTGVVIGPPEVISVLVAMNSVLSLASGNVGQRIVTPLIAGGEICEIADTLIRPFYRTRSLQAQDWIREYFPDSLPYRYHKSEGSLFLWLWFPELPVSTQVLYERLRERGVLVVPGTFFFFGLEQPWKHRDECIRVTYSQNEDAVREGIRIIARTVSELASGRAH